MFKLLDYLTILIAGLNIPFISLFCIVLLGVVNFGKVFKYRYFVVFVLIFSLFYSLDLKLINNDLIKSLIVSFSIVSGFIFGLSLNLFKDLTKAILFVYAFVFFAGASYLNTNIEIISTYRGVINVYTGLFMNSPVIAILLMFSIPVLFLYDKFNIPTNIIIISVALCSLYFITLSGNRTAFFLMFILAVFNYILNYSKIKQKNIYHIVMVFIFALSLIVSFNLLENYYSHYNGDLLLFKRLEEDAYNNDDRIARWVLFLKHFIEEPAGGFVLSKKYIGGSYFHNVFMDMYDKSGILLVLAYFIMMANYFYSILNVIKNKFKDSMQNYLVACFAIFMVYYNMEPVSAAGNNFMVINFFFYGLTLRFKDELYLKNSTVC
jgi:hypothetical protein